MKNNYSFEGTIETRSDITGGHPNYIVRGYAAVPDHPYAYKYFKDGVSFKEMFTQKGISNLLRKAKSKNIFVDALHEIGTLHNTKELLKRISKKSGVDISNEANEILTQIKHSDIPLAKIHDIKLDEKGLFVDTRLNPMYKKIDEKHNKYFDAIWDSLENKFLNKFSINFKPTKVENELIDGQVIPKIDDVDIFGISYTQGAANDMCDITEVAMRSAMEVQDEVKRMEEDKKIKEENEILKKKISDMEQKEKAKAEEEKKSIEEAEKKKLAEEKEQIEKEKQELEKQKQELEKKMSEAKEVKESAKSVAPPESKFSKKEENPGEKVIKAVLENAPEVEGPKSGDRINKWGYYKNPATRPNVDGKVGLGELLTAQAQSNAHSKYAEDTKMASKMKNSDIVVRSGNKQ